MLAYWQVSKRLTQTPSRTVAKARKRTNVKRLYNKKHKEKI